MRLGISEAQCVYLENSEGRVGLVDGEGSSSLDLSVRHHFISFTQCVHVCVCVCVFGGVGSHRKELL